MKQTKKTNNLLWILIGVLLIGAVAVWCASCAAGAPNGIEATFKVSTVTALLCGIFIVAVLGYLLGSISIDGVSLGTAGVFLVAILFGYLSTLPQLQSIPVFDSFFIQDSSAALNTYYSKIIQNVGLVLFVTSVGFIAGPNFFKNLKKNATSFVLLGAMIIVSGAAVAALFALIPGIGPEFSVGVMSGALTSTPGFSAALEAAESIGHATDIITLGYAIAYPFGVIGVVLFVQLMPKLLKADMNKERELLKAGVEEKTQKMQGLFSCDAFGLGAFALAVVFGLALGSVNIPLTGAGYAGPCFSLGTTGGTLIMSLIFGHFGHIGRFSLEVSDRTLKVFREFGLMLFLTGAGVSGGVSLVSEIGKSSLGGMIVVYGLIGGALMTIIPMLIGFLFAKYILKLSLLNSLGSITGGMTSTPALGTLINTAKTDDVAAAYASTYPIALVLVVLAAQLIITLMG
ncbi:MAG: permease [Oscillospiraceae bacterium]|nr:permease [Oscillospiraceae bacterium]